MTLVFEDDEFMRRTLDHSYPLVLVACSGQKLDHAAEAQDLYVGDLFKKSRAWAERFGWCWYILSAKHGVLPPGKVIKPYDLTLNDMTPHELAAWSRMVGDHLLPGRRTVILAGERYRLWAKHRPDVDVPMAGLRIGQQKAWLKAQLSLPAS